MQLHFRALLLLKKVQTLTMKSVIMCNLVSRLQTEVVSDLIDLILSAKDSCVCLSHSLNPLMYQCVLGLSIERKIRRKKIHHHHHCHNSACLCLMHTNKVDFNFSPTLQKNLAYFHLTSDQVPPSFFLSPLINSIFYCMFAVKKHFIVLFYSSLKCRIHLPYICTQNVKNHARLKDMHRYRIIEYGPYICAIIT